MVLFLICTVPCASLLYVRLLYGRFFSTDEIRSSFLYGLLSQLIALLPILILHKTLPVRYTPERLFFTDWMRDFFGYWIIGVILFTIFRKKVLRLPTNKGKWVSGCAFWSGFLLFAGLYQAIYHFPHFTPYRLFLYPVLILLFIWWSAFSTYYLFVSEGVVKKIISIFGSIILTLVLAVIPFTFSVNYDLWGYIGFSAILLLILSGVYLVEIKKLPV